MDTADEIPLEDHRYFWARLDHLESRHPAVLLHQLKKGTLTGHLRSLTARAVQARAHLVIKLNIPEDQADEIVMCLLVADTQEPLHLLSDQNRRNLLRSLASAYRSAIPDLPRTYQSQSEIIE